MTVDTDSTWCNITFDNGEVWNLPDHVFNNIIILLLSPSQLARHYNQDYRGVVSKKRYNAAKKEKIRYDTMYRLQRK